MIDGFAKEDPPTRKMLPVESDVPELLVEMGYSKPGTAHTRAVGDLSLIAFYYLLHIGEYTLKGKCNNTKQTVQFKLEDVTFYKRTRNGQLRCLPKNAPAHLILSADSATLKLDNQKNGWKGVCVHQESNGDILFCPIRALGRHVVHLCRHKAAKSNFLSTFYHEGKKCDVTGKDISKGLKMAATLLEYLETRGIPIKLIDTHSLRCSLGFFGHPNSKNGTLARSHVQGVYQGAARVLLGGDDYKDETQFQVCQCTWQLLLQCYKHMCPFGVRKCSLRLFCLRY
jgi:hypothetical protein